MAGHDDAGWLIELPAGSFKLWYEEPHEATKLEVEGERGYQVDELEQVSTFYVSPGSCTERIHLFYAVVSAAQKLSQGGGLKEEHGAFQMVKLPASEIDALITNGTIPDIIHVSNF